MPKLLSLFFIWGVLLSPSNAQKLSLDFFTDKLRSFIKDFYISQYLDTNASSSDAKELMGQVNNMNYRLFYKFVDTLEDDTLKRVKYCLKLKSKFYKGKSDDCIAMGLTPYKSTKLNSNTLLDISKQIKSTYPNLAKKYEIIASKSFEKLMSSDNKTLTSTFTSVGGKFREEHFNHKIPINKLLSLSHDPIFSKMVIKIIRSEKLDNLKKSIIKIDSSKLSNKANFMLAMNALKHQKEDVAIWYLKLAAKKAKLQMQKDQATFWQYLVSKDKNDLQPLKKSKDINIYTLQAYKILGLKTKKIYTSIEPKNETPPFDITDPFAWVKVKNRFKKNKYSSYAEKKSAALKLNSNDTQAHVSTLIYKFKLDEHYFLKPHFQHLKDLPKKRAALILALARQESRFIPTSVSYSYALGMMQFMPYVAKGIATKNNFKDFKYEDLFVPEISYKFANIHLSFLEKSLYHPLFIAYAYNGGIGFTRRQILTKEYFKEGKYEPFMSLEMVPNSQARHYGKKVLANYIVYANLLGVKGADINTLFDTLKPPHRMHRF